MESEFPDDQEEVTAIVSAKRLTDTTDRTRAFVIVIAGASVGEMHPVDQALTVGRSQRVDLSIHDEGASRRHARLYTHGDVTYVEDLDSKNGTFVNGRRIKKPVPLRDGDKIQVGATFVLKFSLQDRLDEQFQRNLYEAAARDALTRAYNKKAFRDRLDQEWAYAERHDSPLTLILFDLDHFKQTNDTFGHAAGDYVLATVAKLVSGVVRQEDCFARVGGEEFAILCRGITKAQTFIVAERLRTSIAEYAFEYDGRPLLVTVSVGVAGAPAPSIESTQDLFQAADKALYRSKSNGRNQVSQA
ncbi:MAG: GGDEF domain-containing protein [Myxococcota bacterium]